MDDHLLPARAAAARLGVKPATLYAYVSRGRVAARRRPGRRGSWFDPVELDAVAGRSRAPAERRPELRVASAITRIEGGRYWYRGEAPDALAETRSFEAVAEWLWTGVHRPEPVAWAPDVSAAARARDAVALLPRAASPTDRLRVVIAVLAAADPLRADLRPAGALATARRLMATSVAALARRPRGSVAAQVASWLGPARPAARHVDAVRRALIVMADHELAASTVAARVAASFKADPYAAAGAGLGAVSGAWHGAASRRIEDLLDTVRRGHAPADAIGRLLGSDAPVPGFGHPLYPDGDPRVGMLLPLARAVDPAVAAGADRVLAVAAAQGVPPPNVDFALGVLTRALGFAAGAGEGLFAVGRLAGWLAHALEEYSARTDFRLRAVYTGPRTAPAE